MHKFSYSKILTKHELSYFLHAKTKVHHINWVFQEESESEYEEEIEEEIEEEVEMPPFEAPVVEYVPPEPKPQVKSTLVRFTNEMKDN